MANPSKATSIPSDVLTQIVQSDLPPGILVMKLNEMEISYRGKTPIPMKNPSWKLCKVCSALFYCSTSKQRQRMVTCSSACKGQLLARSRSAQVHPPEQRSGMILKVCDQCGKEVWRPKAWMNNEHFYCSRRCHGLVASQKLIPYAGKGRKNWTEETIEAHRERVSGPNSNFWKGGITLYKKKGSYKGVRYVHCPKEYMDMARSDGLVPEHRLIVAQAIGRSLQRSENVHHINHDSTDNRVENLALFASVTDHKNFEYHGSPAPIWSGGDLSGSVA